MSARSVVLHPVDIVTLLLALDMLASYAQTQRTVAVGADNKFKTAAMQAMIDHIGRLRTMLR